MFGCNKHNIYTDDEKKKLLRVNSEENFEVIRRKNRSLQQQEKNNKPIKSAFLHRLLTKTSINYNRILKRIAFVPFLNDSEDEEAILKQFYQSPYGKLLLSILCSTDALGANKRFVFQDPDPKKKTELKAPQLRKYIIKYFKEHFNKLEELQNNIINEVKNILHNDERLFNVLPKIDLLYNFNSIQNLPITNANFQNNDSIFNIDLSQGSFLAYLVWRLANRGHSNLNLKHYFRQYVLQPRLIQALNDSILPLIKKNDKELARQIHTLL